MVQFNEIECLEQSVTVISEECEDNWDRNKTYKM